MTNHPIASAQTVAWFHPVSGIAGDMTLGALLDAGADLDYIVETLKALPVEGWALHREAVLRNGLAATKALVDAPEHHHHRHWSDIRDMLATADLPERVRDRAHRVFEALAIAEGHMHGVEPEAVHFHEVGALDAIVDIVGSCAALESLGIDVVASAPVSVGVGSITAAHGVLPNPAPAVVKLLEGIPTVGVDIDLELTTPTGAAIIAALAESVGPMPTMTITSSGYGAGGRDLPDRPNVTQVVIGETAGDKRGDIEHRQLVELSTNLDDITGELLADTIDELLTAGALDAWITPIIMKKGRPAHTVHALVAPDAETLVSDAMFRATGTLGIRSTSTDRYSLQRTTVTVSVDGHSIDVKVGPHRSKAEHDHVVAAAAALRRPARDIAAQAERLAAET
jgi:pyridinium-3,5-bisthiocarboxylic acid mononucleotide nickel chelatase